MPAVWSEVTDHDPDDQGEAATDDDADQATSRTTVDDHHDNDGSRRGVRRGKR